MRALSSNEMRAIEGSLLRLRASGV